MSGIRYDKQRKTYIGKTQKNKNKIFQREPRSVFFFVRKEDLKSFHIKTASLKYDIQEEVCSFPSEKLFRNF